LHANGQAIIFLLASSCFGEVERGISLQRNKPPDFAAMLAAWLDQTLNLQGDRVPPFNLASARRWGELSAALGHHGADL
jgi:toxin FitB